MPNLGLESELELKLEELEKRETVLTPRVHPVHHKIVIDLAVPVSTDLDTEIWYHFPHRTGYMSKKVAFTGSTVFKGELH